MEILDFQKNKNLTKDWNFLLSPFSGDSLEVLRWVSPWPQTFPSLSLSGDWLTVYSADISPDQHVVLCSKEPHKYLSDVFKSFPESCEDPRSEQWFPVTMNWDDLKQINSWSISKKSSKKLIESILWNLIFFGWTNVDILRILGEIFTWYFASIWNKKIVKS